MKRIYVGSIMKRIAKNNNNEEEKKKEEESKRYSTIQKLINNV